MVGGPQDLTRGALAMDATLSWRIVTETENTACTNPDEVGFQRHRRHILRGVYVNDAGEPLLGTDGQMVSADDAWDVIRDTCRAPRDVSILDLQDCAAPVTLAGREVQGNVIYTYLFREERDPDDPTAVIEYPVNGDGGRTPPHTPQPNPQATFCAAGDYPPPEGPIDSIGDVPVAECEDAHDGRFNQGSRAGFIRRIVYPADWPVADVEVSWIVDRCFAPVHATGTDHRDRTCPQGQTGQVTEGRAISWYDRTWADRAHNAPADTRTAAQALGAWSEDDDQTALEWYDKVSAGDWSVARNTCQPARSGGGDGRGSWDVNGDGFGDFRTEDEARAYMVQVYLDDPDATGPEFNLIRPAAMDCSQCNGPDRSTYVAPEPGNNNGERPRPGTGGFFSSVGEFVSGFFSAIFGRG